MGSQRRIDMYSKLSETQKLILEKTGKFVVRACPGSGKTYCVAAKVSKLIDSWDNRHQGIAIISFTNTAWQEIEQKCKNDFDTSIEYPHFLGTIDSFINQYVFLPFGNLIMGCKERPTLVGEPYGIWNTKQFSTNQFDNISYDINGKMYRVNERALKNGWENNTTITDAKARLNKAGFATQADANFYAMKVLEDPKFSIVLKSLAQKFTWLIIDEAQDTSDIQMKIIDLLIDAGIENVMVVGDPDQAIFEWNNAKPELFEQKYTEWKENSMELYESYRSSQLICNVVQKISLSPKENTMQPAQNNDVKDCLIQPEIWTYDENDKNAIIQQFLQKCECIPNKCEKGKHNKVVLSRAKTFFAKKVDNANPNVWNDNDTSFTKEFMKGKYLYDTNRKNDGLRYIERCVAKVLLEKDNHIIQEEIDNLINAKGGIVAFRKALLGVVQRMPETTTTLGNWIILANNNVNIPNSKLKVDFKISSKANDLTFQDVFPMEDKDFQEETHRVSTIHKVKGETYEAVLVFLKESAGNNTKYENLFKIINGEISGKTQAQIDKCKEEQRVVYVALSRARKLLVIAVPNEECQKLWDGKLNLSNDI